MKILMVSWSILPRPGGSSIIVEQLANNFAASELVVLGASGLRSKRENLDRKRKIKFLYFPTEISVFGRGARFFEQIRKRRFKSLVKEIERIIDAEKIDRIIGVFPDQLYCYAACQAAKNKQLPFFSYFHNTFIENSAIKDTTAPAIQAEIFDHSKIIFVMSKGMQKFYDHKYPQHQGKFIPLVHTFDHLPTGRGIKWNSGKRQKPIQFSCHWEFQ